jgi:arylamine N-acetyltransferase
LVLETANHHQYRFRQTRHSIEQLRGADEARVTHRTVHLQLRAQGDAEEGAQRMQISKALMRALLVQLLTLNINQVRVQSAIPAVSVFGIQVMARRGAEGACDAADIHVAVVMS